MAAAATVTYTGDGCIPCWAPEKVVTDAVQLVPGTYSDGQVIGQNATLTAANDVQTLTVTGTPTGGSFVIAFNGETATVAFNAAVADVQAALDAMVSIGAGGTVVSGAGALPGNAQTITFSGSKTAGRKMPNFSIYSNSLTGGSTPAAAFAHTTPGRTLGGAWAAYDDGASDGTQTAKAILKYGGTVDTFGNHMFGGGEWGSKSRSAVAYFAGYFKTKNLVGIDANGCADLGRIVRGSTASLTNEATVLAMF